jgi:hypothetical protein
MARKTITRSERFLTKPKGVPRSNISRIDNTVLDSEAFVALSATAIRILMGYYRRRRWDKKTKRWTNLQDIIYTLEQMMWECNASKQTVIDARQELIDLGFINIAIQTQGRVFGTDNKAPNVYEISDRYLKWHPDAGIRKANKFKEHAPLRKKTAPKTAFKSKQHLNFPKSGIPDKPKSGIPDKTKNTKSGIPDLEIASDMAL